MSYNTEFRISVHPLLAVL